MLCKSFRALPYAVFALHLKSKSQHSRRRGIRFDSGKIPGRPPAIGRRTDDRFIRRQNLCRAQEQSSRHEDRRRRGEVAASMRPMSTPRPVSRRDVRGAAQAKLLSAAVPKQLRRRRRRHARARPPVRGARAGLRLVRHGARHAPHPGRLHRAPRCGIAVLPQLPAGSSSSSSCSIGSITSENGTFGRHALQHLRRAGATAAASSSTRTRRPPRTASTPTRSSSPAAATPTRRPAIRCWCCSARADYTLDADGHVGHDGHARHVQPGLEVRRLAAAEEQILPGIVRRLVGADDGPVLAHPVVRAVARHRRRRGRPRRGIRARRGAQEARAWCRRRRRAWRRLSAQLQLDAQQRAGCATSSTRSSTRPDGMRGAAHDRLGAEDEQAQDVVAPRWRRRSSTRRCRSSASSPTRTTRSSRVGRQYRDSLSAALMISNDRIASKSASMLLVLKDD